MWLEIKFWIWSLLPFSFISCFQLSKYIWLWSFTDGEGHLPLMDFLKTKKTNAAKYWKCFPKSATDNGRILYVTDLIHGSVFLLSHLRLIFTNIIFFLERVAEVYFQLVPASLQALFWCFENNWVHWSFYETSDYEILVNPFSLKWQLWKD